MLDQKERRVADSDRIHRFRQSDRRYEMCGKLHHRDLAIHCILHSNLRYHSRNLSARFNRCGQQATDQDRLKHVHRSPRSSTASAIKVTAAFCPHLARNLLATRLTYPCTSMEE